MEDTIDILKKLALQVRNASSAGENTAERVGRVLSGILELVDENVDIEELKKLFLGKYGPDETEHLLKLLGGTFVRGGIDTDSILTNLLSSKNFVSGALGTGMQFHVDSETGKSYIEVDELFVRMKAIFTDLVIEKLSHVGGQMLLTPASMVCINVEETELAYRCYFKSTDGEKSIYNEFVVDDQATIREFNVKPGVHQNISNRYYWRLVTAIGDDYIDLSKTDCDAGSGIPQAGDNICQLGNRTLKERQDAQILSSYGSDAPSFKQYVGINGYSLKDKEESRLEPGNNELSGIVHIKNGSTGAGNLTDLPIEIQKAADLGSVNLLRNSGFTGQYENEELTPETLMSAESELYNKKLSNWTGLATVNESIEAMSGYAATLGSLSQSIKLIVGENYVVSYNASGTSVAVSCGNYSMAQVLSSTPTRYVHKFRFTGSQLFLVSGTAILCNLKLERGTIATDWTPSPLDNDKSMAEMQALSYIQNAIKEGSVDMIGGLALMNMLQLGNYRDGKMQQVTAGVSGIYNDDDDVAFWSGGTFEQAIRTVMFYKDNPNAIPTAEELKLMANFAVTHGGRVILNDIIARGVFIVQSSGKTIEQELEGMSNDIAEVETRFEVKEGQVASSVKETKSYAQIASNSSTSASDSASSAAVSAKASEDAKVISVEKASEAKQTAEGFQTTVTETTKKAVTDAVAGADEVIEEKVGTAVTQSAKEWKVEVMGADAQGNPNTVLSAINADASGIKIKGDKVEIDGTLLAQIIMATGLNINDKFIIDKDGKMTANEGVFKGKVEIAGGKILLNEDGSGQLAGGGIFWDSNGVLYNRNKMRPSWRILRTEMNEAGISPGGYYALKTEKGTYLNALTTYDDTRIVSLPDPSQVDALSNSLNDDIDVKVSLIGRLADAYRFTCPMGDIVIYNATTGNYDKVARVGFANSAGGDYVGTFKVKYANDNWSWLAGGDFVSVS